MRFILQERKQVHKGLNGFAKITHHVDGKVETGAMAPDSYPRVLLFLTKWLK